MRFFLFYLKGLCVYFFSKILFFLKGLCDYDVPRPLVVGHRNVYVGVHMPHSHSRHRSHHHHHHHRHKRKHHHGRHGNGHSRHRGAGDKGEGGVGGVEGQDSPPAGSLTPPQGEGGEAAANDSYAEITSLQPPERQRHGRFSDVTTPSSNEVEGWGQPRYAKSMSLPAGITAVPQTIPMGKIILYLDSPDQGNLCIKDTIQ